jgi:putative transposase
MRVISKGYRFAMSPSPEQETAMARFAGARRFIWNWALARKREYYQEHGKGLPEKVLSVELTALKSKPETAWLREVDSQLPQQALADLQKAFTAFFEHRARYPRFKSKKSDRARFRIPQRVKVDGDYIVVPKIGRVRFSKCCEVDGIVKSVTFSQDATGRWFASICCQVQIPDIEPIIPATEEAILGLDLGLRDALVRSDGKREANPRHFRTDQRRLRRAQKTLSRRKRGSKGRERAKLRVAHVHRRVANKRRDFLHKLTTGIVNEAGAVCIEDLNVRGLARTKLAKSIYDAAFGQIRFQLTYKSDWSGKPVAIIDRFYPSSKTCHCCGTVNDALTLGDRRWQCSGCETVLDRDFNAALNIRDEGIRVLLAAGLRRGKTLAEAA